MQCGGDVFKCILILSSWSKRCTGVVCVQIPSGYIRPDVSANLKSSHQGPIISHMADISISTSWIFWGIKLRKHSHHTHIFLLVQSLLFCEFQLWVHVCFQSDCFQVWLCPLIWCVCEQALLCNTLYSDSCSLQKVSAIQNQEWI